MIDSSDSTRAAPPPLGREGFGGWGLGFGPCPAPLEGPWRSPGKGGAASTRKSVDQIRSPRQIILWVLVDYSWVLTGLVYKFQDPWSTNFLHSVRKRPKICRPDPSKSAELFLVFPGPRPCADRFLQAWGGGGGRAFVPGWCGQGGVQRLSF